MGASAPRPPGTSPTEGHAKRSVSWLPEPCCERSRCNASRACHGEEAENNETLLQAPELNPVACEFFDPNEAELDDTNAYRGKTANVGAPFASQAEESSRARRYEAMASLYHKERAKRHPKEWGKAPISELALPPPHDIEVHCTLSDMVECHTDRAHLLTRVARKHTGGLKECCQCCTGSVCAGLVAQDEETFRSPRKDAAEWVTTVPLAATNDAGSSLHRLPLCLREDLWTPVGA